MLMIVYCLTNKINGKRYVGLTTKSLEQRFTEHVKAALREPKYPVQYAIRKHGKEAFYVGVLQTCSSLKELGEAEISWIARLDTQKTGYNIKAGGNGGLPGK